MLKFPFKVIWIDGKLYMTRFYLGQFFGITLYLHKWHSSDPERGLHNHPFSGGSFVLRGFYRERRLKHFSDNGIVETTKNVRWFNRIKDETFHTVEYISPGLITLFWHTGYKLGKGWGFLSEELHWDKALSGNTSPVKIVYNPADGDRTEGQWWRTAKKKFLWD